MVVNLKSGVLDVEDSRELDSLITYGSRINRKRKFLFISKVLGKHLPTDPLVMEQNYTELSELLKDKFLEKEKFTLIIGFAETATALGWGVFDALNLENSHYIHTTRYSFNRERLLTFYEEHSHSPSHILYKPDINLSKVTDILLVDDEITTGKSAENLVKELQNIFKNVGFHLISMLNWREDSSKNFEDYSLYRGKFKFSENIEYEPVGIDLITSESETYAIKDQIAPYNFGRFGSNSSSFSISKDINIETIKEKRVLVVGTGEFMYQPYLFAKRLKKLNIDVLYQATTRSPIAIDGAITSSIEFKDNYFENIDNFIYNLDSADYDLIYICYEVIELPKEFRLKKLLENRGFNVEEIFFKTV